MGDEQEEDGSNDGRKCVAAVPSSSSRRRGRRPLRIGCQRTSFWAGVQWSQVCICFSFHTLERMASLSLVNGDVLAGSPQRDCIIIVIAHSIHAIIHILQMPATLISYTD